MKKILAVARWEFIEKVKTKAFIISLILTPAIIIAFGLAPTILTSKEENSTKVIGIVDTSGLFIRGMKNELDQYKLKGGEPAFIIVNLTDHKLSERRLIYSSDSLVLSGKVEGYLLINSGGSDTASAQYRSKSTVDSPYYIKLESSFNKVKVKLKLDKEGLDPALANILTRRNELTAVNIVTSGGKQQKDFLLVFFTSFIFIVLLMMMILSSGGMLVRNLVEEKSNRLIEILISSCSTNDLLAGKVLGLSALGLTQVIIWSLIGITLSGASVIPSNAFDNILPQFIYFVLGFVFYTAIFVGVGSIVTTEQEAQQITSYLSLTLILPIAISVPAIENPNSPYIHVLSYIPFTIPSTMILRFNIEVIPFKEILLTSFIMLASIYIAINLSSKIFKIGILSYGKRPSLKELFNWLKEK